MKNILLLVALLPASGFGQYAVSASAATTAAAEINSKPAWQSGSGAPSVNCTAAKDFYTDTANAVLYFCSATNTWSKVPSSGSGSCAMGNQSGTVVLTASCTGGTLSGPIPIGYYSLTQTANVTVTFAATVPGIYAFFATENGTGGWTLTWPGSFTTPPSVVPNAGTVNWYEGYWDTTTMHFVAGGNTMIGQCAGAADPTAAPPSGAIQTYCSSQSSLPRSWNGTNYGTHVIYDPANAGANSTNAGCSANMWANDLGYNGFLRCAQPASTNLSDTANLVRITAGATFGAFTYAFGAASTLDAHAAAHTLPMLTVATAGSLPSTCAAGEQAVVTGATLGQQIYECSTGNVWTQELASAGTGTPSGSSGDIQDNAGGGSFGASTAHLIIVPFTCADSSGSGAVQVCNTNHTFTPASGDHIIYSTTTTNTGDVTVNVNSLGAKHIRKWSGSAVLAAGDLAANVPVPMTYDGTFWEVAVIANAPSGVSAVTASMGLGSSGGPTPNITLAPTTRSETGSYNPVTGDCGNRIFMSAASNPSMVFPQAGATGFLAGCKITVANSNTGGIILVTATTSTFVFHGGSAGVANWFQGLDNVAIYTSDGTNWQVETSFPQLLYVALADSCLNEAATANVTIGPLGNSPSCVSAFASAEAFATGTFTFPANFFTATTQVRVSDSFANLATASPGNVTASLNLQGTPIFTFSVTSYSNVASTQTGAGQEYLLTGTGAPGSSVAVAASATARAWMNTSVAAPYFASVATNGTLLFTQTLQFASNVAGNSVDLYKTVIKWESY